MGARRPPGAVAGQCAGLGRAGDGPTQGVHVVCYQEGELKDLEREGKSCNILKRKMV